MIKKRIFFSLALVTSLAVSATGFAAMECGGHQHKIQLSRDGNGAILRCSKCEAHQWVPVPKWHVKFVERMHSDRAMSKARMSKNFNKVKVCKDIYNRYATTRYPVMKAVCGAKNGKLFGFCTVTQPIQ